MTSPRIVHVTVSSFTRVDRSASLVVHRYGPVCLQGQNILVQKLAQVHYRMEPPEQSFMASVHHDQVSVHALRRVVHRQILTERDYSISANISHVKICLVPCK